MLRRVNHHCPLLGEEEPFVWKTSLIVSLSNTCLDILVFSEDMIYVSWF